jgi:DNA-binding transcriptional ArsR family regulator
MKTQAVQANARQASRLLKALSNHYRLLIVCELLDQECSVGELVRRVGLSQSALSQHLAKLRRDSLVRTRRDAQTIYYSLASRELKTIVSTLEKLFKADDKGGVSGRGESISAAAA